MTPMRCAQAIAEYLQEKFDSIGYLAPDERTEGKPMHVYAGFLPRAMSDKEKMAQAPCIVIRPVKVVDTDAESTADLQILAATYNRAVQDGHLELYHVLELCRQWLCQSPVIGNMFMMKKPLETGIPEEQGFPEWIGYMKVTYTIGTPGINVNRMLEDERNFM